jgi:hypothetical protein
MGQAAIRSSPAWVAGGGSNSSVRTKAIGGSVNNGQRQAGDDQRRALPDPREVGRRQCHAHCQHHEDRDRGDRDIEHRHAGQVSQLVPRQLSRKRR